MQCSRQLVATFRHVFTRQRSSAVREQCRSLQLWPPKRTTYSLPLVQRSLMVNNNPLTFHLRGGFNWFGGIRNHWHSTSGLIERAGMRRWYQTCPSINGYLSLKSGTLVNALTCIFYYHSNRDVNYWKPESEPNWILSCTLCSHVLCLHILLAKLPLCYI